MHTLHTEKQQKKTLLVMQAEQTTKLVDKNLAKSHKMD